MRLYLPLLLLLISGCGFIWSDQRSICSFYYKAVLADSPQAYWRLDETSNLFTYDLISNNTGGLVGGFTLNQPGGLTRDASPAIKFDGATGYSLVSNNITYGPTLTLEALVKVEALGTTQVIFGNCIDANSNCTGLDYKVVSLQLSTTNAVEIMLVPTTWARRTYGFTGNNIISIGQWYHLVGTIDSTTNTVSIYINGVSQSLTMNNAGSGSSTFSAPVAIGSMYSTWSSSSMSFANGTIDEMAIYNYVLPQSRILLHSEIARNGPCPN